MTAEADEHVLRLDAPVGPERPFDAAADRSGGDGVGGRGGDDPVAAAGGHIVAVVEDRGAGRYEGGATLRVSEDITERVAEPARDHRVPVARLGAAEDVGCAAEGGDRERRANQGIEG